MLIQVAKSEGGYARARALSKKIMERARPELMKEKLVLR
jgi:hypothetical protein